MAARSNRADVRVVFVVLAASFGACSADSSKDSTPLAPSSPTTLGGSGVSSLGTSGINPGGLGASGRGVGTGSMPAATAAAASNLGGVMSGTSGRPASPGMGAPAVTAPATAGRSGAPTTPAGTSGAGGASMSPSGPPPATSEGCGNASPPASMRYTIQVADLMREYIVAVPTNYDPSTPHKLIFAWHYLGGNAQTIASGFGGSGYYGLQAMANNTVIFVAPEGIDAAWPNTGGRDVNFAKAMVDWMRKNYCIDNKRIFSVGFSYGAIMSNTVGCQMGDVFRAIAPMSGSGPLSFGANACKGPVAAWLSHGMSDTTVPFASGQASRDYWAKANGCATTTQPTDPSPCVAYDGCMAGYPVTWCEFPGMHQQPTFAPAAIWKFFSQF